MKTWVLAAGLVLLAGPAVAAGAEGNGALALAAMIAAHSPSLSPAEKALLSAYLDGRPKVDFRGRKKIVVRADSVTCRISDVDITAKHCELAFHGRTISTFGREAQALYATLIEVGAPSSGAAGSIYEAVKRLQCAIDPAEVRQEGGGGASCNFENAQ